METSTVIILLITTYWLILFGLISAPKRSQKTKTPQKLDRQDS